MLRKLKSLTDSSKPKIPDIKQITTLLTMEERDILAHKITDFCEKISDMRILYKSVAITAKQYTQMRLEYGLGLKTLADCEKTYGPFAECLLDDTIAADSEWSIYTNYLNRHAWRQHVAIDPIKFHNDLADAFIKLYKKHLDTPSTLALLTTHSYAVIPRIKPVLNAFQETRGANEHDFLFCCEFACNEQINFLEAEHVMVILQKLADLREHKADTALHRNFILQILKNTKAEWGFRYLEISDLYALIQHIEALPVKKENALTQLGTHFYDVYWHHLRSLQENGFNEEADIRFTLSQLLRGTIQYMDSYLIGTALSNLRAAGLDTPQNRENLYAKNESERSNIYLIVDKFERIQLRQSPLRQAVFQHILDKPENRWPLTVILEKLHKNQLLSHDNIKKILDKSDFIPDIEIKLSLHTRGYTTPITQELFDRLSTTDQDRDIAFFMSAHGRLGKASSAKTITTHGPISDPKYLPGFLSTFYSKPQQKAPHPENSHAADDETPTLR